jgi:hypothetical protein
MEGIWKRSNHVLIGQRTKVFSALSQRKTSLESVSMCGGFAAQGALFWWGINEVPWIKQVKGSVNTSVPFLLQEKDLG